MNIITLGTICILNNLKTEKITVKTPGKAKRKQVNNTLNSDVSRETIHYLS